MSDIFVTLQSGPRPGPQYYWHGPWKRAGESSDPQRLHGHPPKLQYPNSVICCPRLKPCRKMLLGYKIALNLSQRGQDERNHQHQAAHLMALFSATRIHTISAQMQLPGLQSNCSFHCISLLKPCCNPSACALGHAQALGMGSFFSWRRVEPSMLVRAACHV